MPPIFSGYLKTPIGNLLIQGNETDIESVIFSHEYSLQENRNSIIDNCILQLDEYFKGKRTEFTIPLQIKGSLFQENVLKTCTSISFGKTSTYKNIALQLNNPKASIAVGQALKKNPFHIIIPCHRILNSKNKNTGYAGGLWRKDWLLKFESTSNYALKATVSQ